MNNVNIGPLCRQAELYYYDIVSDRSDKPASTPASVIEHIDHCHNCQAQLKRLEAALFQGYGAESEHGGSDSAITATILQLHLAHTNRLVTCETTRPFLPTLLHPVLRVAIPTPITVHVDQCEACSEDLKIIRRMNLSPQQLSRLSRLFADNPSEDTVSCSETQTAALSAVLWAPGESNAAVLRHLCMCGDCRKAVYQYRESLREELTRKRTGQSEWPCDEISTSDIFDYCVPYGIDPTAGRYTEFHESFASHLLSCPTCLGKMQELHSAVYKIAERPNSKVATTYYIAKSTEAQSPAASDDLYAGYPIRVEVTDARDQVESKQPTTLATGLAAALKRRVPVTHFRRFAKIAGLAAVILIAVRLFFGTSSAKAITLAEINKAIENVRNVYIAHFVPGRKEPVQEQWVSRELGFYLIKTGQELALRDVSSGTMRIRRSGDSSIEIMPMSAEMISEARKNMAGSFGLVPFPELSRLPQSSQWGPADGNGFSTVAEGIEVFDLSWAQEARNSPTMMRKWRFFVDSRTGLPQKVELYRKSVIDREYDLQFVKTVEYLTDKQMQKAVNEGFPTTAISLGQPQGMSVLVGVAASSDQ